MIDWTSHSVLIVDDEVELREVFGLWFSTLGCQVFKAASGTEALSLVRTQPVSAIVSDIRMPNGNGIELVQALKQLRIHAPVIFVSAFSDISEIDGYALGVERVLSKPCQRKDVLEAVQRCLLSPEQRWAQKSARPRALIEVRSASGSPGYSFGRGGFFAPVTLACERGSVMEFQIEKPLPGIELLECQGIVRWVRRMQPPAGIGVEISYVPLPLRKQLREALRVQDLTAFIPKQ
jgi:CheY-like chemotaxis protein